MRCMETVFGKLLSNSSLLWPPSLAIASLIENALLAITSTKPDLLFLSPRKLCYFKLTSSDFLFDIYPSKSSGPVLEACTKVPYLVLFALALAYKLLSFDELLILCACLVTISPFISSIYTAVADPLASSS